MDGFRNLVRPRPPRYPHTRLRYARCFTVRRYTAFPRAPRLQQEASRRARNLWNRVRAFHCIIRGKVSTCSGDKLPFLGSCPERVTGLLILFPPRIVYHLPCRKTELQGGGMARRRISMKKIRSLILQKSTGGMSDRQIARALLQLLPASRIPCTSTAAFVG